MSIRNAVGGVGGVVALRMHLVSGRTWTAGTSAARARLRGPDRAHLSPRGSCQDPSVRRLLPFLPEQVEF